MTTTLAMGGDSAVAEAADDCHALETNGGHFMSHTDRSALEVSTALSPLLWSSSMDRALSFLTEFCLKRRRCVNDSNRLWSNGSGRIGTGSGYRGSFLLRFFLFSF